MGSFCSEHEMVTELIMPFLRENWDNIDLPEPNSGFGDGRLTRDELEFARAKAIARERLFDAYILGDLLKRYESICLSHEDAYWWKEEMLLGISEEDISVYEQLLHPDFKKENGKPSPKEWY